MFMNQLNNNQQRFPYELDTYETNEHSYLAVNKFDVVF